MSFYFYVESNLVGDAFLSFIREIGLPTRYDTDGYFYRKVHDQGETGGARDLRRGATLSQDIPLLVYTWGNLYQDNYGPDLNLDKRGQY